MIVRTLRMILDTVERKSILADADTFEVKVDLGPGCDCCKCGFSEKQIKHVVDYDWNGSNIVLKTE